MKKVILNIAFIMGIIFIHRICVVQQTEYMFLFALLGGICIGFYTDNVYKKGGK